MNLYQELEWRGLVHNATEHVAEALEKPVAAYIGFDPTARSLHVGSLLPLTMLGRLQRAGHKVYALVGGGTGMIGDPSGKSAERQLLTPDVVRENVIGIREQIGRFVRFDGDNPAVLVDNADWLARYTLVDFLREIGKHFSVNVMLAKESVKRRIETGISFTEFTYMLMQAADFLELHDRHRVTVQCGGSDQWGNITAGCDLIRSKRQVAAHGFTWPLVTNSAGVKFGKTEGGAVWLDAGMTSPYRFYQFFLGADDGDVVKYLKMFTTLPREEIEELEKRHLAAPHERAAHTRLAEEMTRTVHGESGLERAKRGTRALFHNEFEELSESEFDEVMDAVPTQRIDAARIEAGLPILDALVESGLAPSKGEARKLIGNGGIYVNKEKVDSIELKLTAEHTRFSGKVILLRKGKRSYTLLRIERSTA